MLSMKQRINPPSTAFATVESIQHDLRNKFSFDNILLSVKLEGIANFLIKVYLFSIRYKTDTKK